MSVTFTSGAELVHIEWKLERFQFVARVHHMKLTRFRLWILSPGFGMKEWTDAEPMFICLTNHSRQRMHFATDAISDFLLVINFGRQWEELLCSCLWSVLMIRWSGRMPLWAPINCTASAPKKVSASLVPLTLLQGVQQKKLRMVKWRIPRHWMLHNALSWIVQLMYLYGMENNHLRYTYVVI